ncbi:MAG: hypothetical protein LBJ95_05290 [Oscillospiraceae bacterium]|jgi:hypothetical protein|nr:hypothetical protein [Oscillospiraceae bacterium]
MYIKPSEPRNDVLAFPAIIGSLYCKACGAQISEGDTIHHCISNGYTYFTYRSSPDGTIWRRD